VRVVGDGAGDRSAANNNVPATHVTASKIIERIGFS
jgi:hypothetical protein